jgi:hypothetical protein
MSAFEPHHPGPLGESLNQGLSVTRQGTLGGEGSSRGTFGPATIRHEPAVWSNAVKATKQNTRDTTAEGWTSQEEEADTAAFNEAVTIDDGETFSDLIRDMSDYLGVPVTELGGPVGDIDTVDCQALEAPPQGYGHFGKPSRACFEFLERMEDRLSTCKAPENCFSCGEVTPDCPSCDFLVHSRYNNCSLVFDDAGKTTHTQSDEDFLNAVWSMLRDNDDIVRWVVCLVQGERKASCVVDQLYDCKDPLKIKFDNDIDVLEVWNLDFGMRTMPLSNNIHLKLTAGFYRLCRDSYLRSTGATQACAVAAFCGALLHELLHTCLTTDDMNDADGDCDGTHMVDNAFVWAISKRYPCLTSATACSWFGDDCVWMNAFDSGFGIPPEGCGFNTFP